MAATTMISGSVITVRAAVAGISGARIMCSTTNASSADVAFLPNFRISQSAIRLASLTLTSMEARMNASRLSQITSMPSTYMIVLSSVVPVTSSRNMRTSEVRYVGNGSVTHQTSASAKQAAPVCAEALSPAPGGR